MKRIKLNLVLLAGSLMPLFSQAHGGHEHGTVEAGTTHAGLWAAGLVLGVMMIVFVKKVWSAQQKHEQEKGRSLYL